jgi:hypothetical protein
MRFLVVLLVLPFLCAAPVSFGQTAAGARDPAKTTSAAGAARTKAGLWEITTSSQAVGTVTKRTVVARTCYSPEDVTNPQRMIPRQHEAGSKCEAQDAKVRGSMVTWRVACSGKDPLSGPAKLTLAADAFSGQGELQRKVDGKSVKVDQEYSAKWVGECK